LGDDRDLFPRSAAQQDTVRRRLEPDNIEAADPAGGIDIDGGDGDGLDEMVGEVLVGSHRA
jgi:hypothetical protein